MLKNVYCSNLVTTLPSMILFRSFVTTGRLQLKKKLLSVSASRQEWFSSGSSNNPVDRKFDEMLSFHDGIAAVRESNGGGAYHVDQSGSPVYSGRRYKRTFGFYAAERAAVMDFDGSFFHIDLTGRPVYDDRYSWCGNFHEVSPDGVFRSPVRDCDNLYYYIDEHGIKLLGPFSYAGDPNSAGHSVVHDLDGNPTIIGVDGRDWCNGMSMIERKVIEALVPHKGIALARDEEGWFYINQEGQEVGGGDRYLFAEPHYNGQARVRFLNGEWGVVDETGKLVISLGESMLSSAVELENVSKRYWESFALKKIIENDILHDEHRKAPPSTGDATFREILKDCSVEMGLIRREQQSGDVPNPPLELLNRGRLLAASSCDGGTGGVSTIAEERCRYWLQDRYLQTWLDSPRATLSVDTFADIATDPAAVKLSQRILKSYADTDWKGAGAVLTKLLHGQHNGSKQFNDVGDAETIRTIVDMGGGYGSLLRELQRSGVMTNTEEFICIDRPEVVSAAVLEQAVTDFSFVNTVQDAQKQINDGNAIKFEVGDLFEGPLQKADLYLLSRVLHDWPDPKAAAILDRLHSLSPESARLCVIDRVSSPEKPHALLSLHMFSLQGARERNHSQWRELFVSSRWQIDGHEQINGHEMYILTKKAITPIPSAATREDTHKSTAGSTFQNSDSSDISKCELVDAETVMPTVRKAVITAGGLGTRMAPQSVVTPKALLPIISLGAGHQPPRWEVRPALSYILDQFHDTSHTVDQVYVASTPQHVPILKLFLSDYNRHRRLSGTESKDVTVQIIIQDSARGFGDAVLAARKAIGDEPFVLAVGDHVFSVDCVKNILAAYKEICSSSDFHDWRDTALTGAVLCNESEVKHTGLLRNQQSAYQLGSPWLVHQMAEKPSSNYESFQFSMNSSSKYPSQLGIDVLPPSIFTFLQAEKDQILPQEEVDLRKVLQESVQSQGNLFGCLIEGHRLDIGNPRDYFSSLQRIANDDAGVYQPSVPASLQVQELQEQDEILRSVRALQLENSVHIPANLRHVLFRRDDACHSPDEIHISSSPGRMDLMCGFADYSGSYAVQHPTAERVVALTVIDDNVNLPAGGDDQGTIRLSCLQVDKLSELPKAVSKGHFKVQETAFPTAELFTAAGRLKSDAELKTHLSQKFNPIDGAPHWASYVTGMINRILREKQSCKQTKSPSPQNLPSVNVVTVSDLPWNTGLASSAAVEVATAISLGKALQLHATIFEPASMAILCKEVENSLGSHCGVLDHLAVLGGSIEHPLVGFQCRIPLEKPTYRLPLPEELSVIALESGVKRRTASSAYKSVRNSAIVGKTILEASCGEEIQYLCDLTPSQFAKLEELLPETMSGREIHARFPGLVADCFEKDPATRHPIRAATRFPIEENHRVQMFQDILRGLHHHALPRESGLRAMRELMAQSHAGYSKCGLGTDATSFLVDAMQCNGVVGAKISGGGGGGAVVAMVDESFLRHSSPFEQLQERYHASTGLTCKLRRGTSGPAKYHGTVRRQFSSSTVTDGRDDLGPRVLIVNHGYPPDFNGGSEIYAQMVALQLKKSRQCDNVHVFAREHDPYRADFEIRKTVDQLDGELPVFRMNYSREAPYFRFISKEVDQAFQDVVDNVKPDIVHLHHMNHLSLNLPAVAKASGAKVLYTLHDYWLMCPRGQFLQTGAARNDPWKLCDGQENGKCAKHCYANRYASGACNASTGQSDREQRYWTSWIASRMDATRSACEHIDCFIAPSQYLRDKFVNEFFLPAEKVVVEPYGFFRDRLAGRKRPIEVSPGGLHEDINSTSIQTQNEDPYVFAYTGRHQPGKGINLLVEAALQLLQNTETEGVPFRVKIFGRQDANSSRSLQRMISECPDPRAADIFSWEAEYANNDIISKVFNEIDCLVVPSIWEENSPLVIHEAQQCRVPVITSSYAGMGELVKDAVNGLTFQHRSAESLAEAMEKAIEQPAGMRFLGERGYLYSPDGQIPCIERHTETLLQLFEIIRSKDSRLGIAKAASDSWYTEEFTKINSGDVELGTNVKDRVHERGKDHMIEHLPAPWRVTFDTNPDDCNFSCTMCEQHSEFSPHQKRRREQNIRKRRMDFEIIRKTVEDLAPKGLREIIPSTMGEPLYYKDFPKILQLCREYDVKLNLTTNGSFYNGGVEHWAEEIIPVASDVKISWNGIRPETQEKIMKKSNLDTQIANLRKFVEIRNQIAQKEEGNYCSVTLQLTFMEVNLQEIPELVKFAIKEDCDRVKGHHLWAHFSEIKNENLRRDEDSIRRWNAIARECRDIVSTHERPSGRPFRLENFYDLDASSRRQQEPHGMDVVDDDDNPTAEKEALLCPFLGREAWVNHSGRFDPCCAPDEERRSLGSFGNITDPETRLLDIWNSDQYENLVQNYTKRELCKNCNMRKPTAK